MMNMVRFKQVICPFLLAGVILPSGVQRLEARNDPIDSCIAAQMAFRHIPGLALAVVKDGVPVKVKGYGIANLELNVPVTTRTLFQSGSVGKQFTAMLVMWLVERKAIDLNTSIAEYFPNSPASWKKITVRHLLTHTSGILNYTEEAGGIDIQSDYTEDQLLEIAQRMPLEFQPGERWAYSNTGYVLLGILVRKVTGVFYGDLLRRHVFDRASMETARIISDSAIIPNRCAGYRMREGEWRNQEWVSPALNSTADGSMYVSIQDMVNWDEALSAGKIISKTGYDTLWMPVRLNDGTVHPYGFGWYLERVNGHRSMRHGGSWQGFNAFIGRYPDDRLTVVVLANLSPSNPEAIARAVAGLYVHDLAARVPAAIEDREPQFTAVVERLYAHTDTMKTPAALFAPEYRSEMPSVLRSNWKFLMTFGPVQSIEMVGYRAGDAEATLTYRIRQKVGSSIVTLRRNAAGEILSAEEEME
jgi:CubicO group peptidase (beta-lactamase class C family)